MGNLLIRKIVVALVSAIVVSLVVVGLMVAMLSPLTIAGESLTLSGALQAPGMLVFALTVALVVGISQVLVAPLLAGRRRRLRGGGTIVESDVEDGRERGVVKWFNVKKGFGFITWDEGEDVFVHFRSIRGEGHRSLTEGQRVKFAVVRGQKGPQAEDVSAVR